MPVYGAKSQPSKTVSMRKKREEWDKKLKGPFTKDECLVTQTAFSFPLKLKQVWILEATKYRGSNDPVRNARGLLIQQSDFPSPPLPKTLRS